MKTKGLSLTMKILLLVLALVVIGAAYYFLVQVPVSEGIRSAEDEAALYEMETAILQSKLIKKNDMTSELEELKKNGTPAELPSYDNLSSVITFIHSAMNGKGDYHLSFSDPGMDNGIARRNAVVTFTASSYDEACSIARNIESCPFMCKIDNVSFKPAYGSLINDDAISVSINIVFYESMN